jgi:hypothetical protein
MTIWMMSLIHPITMMTRKSVATVMAVGKQIAQWSMAGHALSSALPVVEVRRYSVMTATEQDGKIRIKCIGSNFFAICGSTLHIAL